MEEEDSTVSSLTNAKNNNVLHLANTKLTSGESDSPFFVFIHGLNSTRSTWKACMEELAGNFNMISLDLRGHGESPLGAEEDFSAKMLVEDIRHTLIEESVPFPIILIGHSMGGRVGIAYGATYPEDLACLVIEDMDIRLREPMILSEKELAERVSANSAREFSSFDGVKESLSRWYSEERIEKWKSDGRICLRPDGLWESRVSPLTEYYAYQCVLASIGMEEWLECVGKNRKHDYLYPVYVLVATGKDSACDKNCVIRMFNEAQPGRMAIVQFHNSSHSIHRVQMTKFLDELKSKFVPSSLKYIAEIWNKRQS